MFASVGAFVLLCISLVLLSTPTIDYCRKDLCSRGTTHIACNAPLKFGPSCSGKKPKVIPMRNSMKRVLLHEHNRLRAQVASGDLRGYSSASRMPTLTWDGQLQFVAGCNARLCRFEHDKCRSTAQFRWAGQNLAMKSLFGRWRSVRVNQMLQEFVRGWFAEHKDANQAIIDRFPAKYKGPDIGHFTQLVSDRTWKVGCAMVRFSDRAIHYYLVCNYSFINIVDQPIYVKGKPCSRCQLKCNRKYPALCKVGEKIASKP